ncbi:MAG: hypothetical protein ABIW76_14800 [Fibrobacteria bacterium]
MKPGSALGVLVVLSAIELSPAQNLGLGAGSRPVPSNDSAALLEGRQNREDEAPAPRKNQINRRLGLSARRGKDFDPSVFEIRGRELQGQFYEIGTPANLKAFNASPTPAKSTAGKRKDGSKQWLLWVGIAGVTGVSAGSIGYLLMNKAHPTSAPPDKSLVLTDEP